jgi:eukaryotic-like serine/threonine-protein kinase
VGRSKAEKDDEAALPFFQQAVRWDANFAVAYSSLAECYWNIARRGLAMENAKKAYDLRERVGGRDRFRIEGAYYYYSDPPLYLPPSLEKAQQVYEKWVQTYPQDEQPHFNLGNIYSDLGQYEKSLSEFREALRVEPGNADRYVGFFYSLYLKLDRFEEARVAAQKLLEGDPDDSTIHEWLYQLAFVQHDEAGMAQQVAWSAREKKAEPTMINNEAKTAAYQGQIAKARELSRQALEFAKHKQSAGEAWTVEVDAALREALFGDAKDARRRAEPALSYLGRNYNGYKAALALAFAGDTNRLMAFADDWERALPRDTTGHVKTATIRAQVWLDRSDPDKAVETLNATASYALRSRNIFEDILEPSGLYSAYVRGNANLAALHFSDAGADFQEILDHRGIVLNEPTGALAHLGLARARAAQGDTAGAKNAYQDFLNLWKDADPDLPIFKQAKAEYAKLQ